MLFNNSQRRGILLLVFLIMCLFILPQQFLLRKHDMFLLCNDTVVMRKDSFITTNFPASLPQKQIVQAPKLELNTADSISLEALRGIGPYYASKIIRYRQKLGGYHSAGQLKELKMKYFDADSAAHLFTADPKFIVKKDLSTMTFKEVLQHPYLEYEDVKLIFNAKRKYQTISFAILETNGILPAALLKKIKPYFK